MKKAVFIIDNYDYGDEIVGLYDYDKLPKHIKVNVDTVLNSGTAITIDSLKSGLEWFCDSANNVNIEDYEIKSGEEVLFMGTVNFQFK